MGFQDVLFQSFEEHGWAISDRAILPSLTQALYHHAHQLWQQGFFKPASIGRKAGVVHDPDIRGDSICWLDEKSPAPAPAEFLSFANELRQELNRHFFLSLRDQEFHFARYEPGKGYARHVDQHRGSGARKVSLVLYLNEEWKADEGGELCLYAPEDETAQSQRSSPEVGEAQAAADDMVLTKVLPLAGRLAIFRSDLIPHEVLPATRVRWSLTGWFRDDSPL